MTPWFVVFPLRRRYGNAVSATAATKLTVFQGFSRALKPADKSGYTRMLITLISGELQRQAFDFYKLYQCFFEHGPGSRRLNMQEGM